MLATIRASASPTSRRAPPAMARSTKSCAAGNVWTAAAVNARVVGRTGKRIEAVDMLAFDPQRFAARRQNVDLRRGVDDVRRQRRHRFDEMLASIEDQQNALVAQICDQIGRRIVRLDRQAEHRGDRRRHQVGIAEHAEIDEQHRAGESFDQMMSDRYRHRGLADAAGADDGDEARSVELRRQFAERRRPGRPFG